MGTREVGIHEVLLTCNLHFTHMGFPPIAEMPVARLYSKSISFAAKLPVYLRLAANHDAQRLGYGLEMYVVSSGACRRVTCVSARTNAKMYIVRVLTS